MEKVKIRNQRATCHSGIEVDISEVGATGLLKLCQNNSEALTQFFIE